MPKLPRNIKPKKLIIILEKLGFRIVGKKGSHHRLVHPDGRWTQVAVHPKPIPQGTLNAILRQIEMPTEEFIKLFEKK